MKDFLRMITVFAVIAVTSDSMADTNMIARDRPNIVFIMTDDLGWGDVGYHGSKIETPHIDWLAEKGIRLSQHYVSPM